MNELDLPLDSTLDLPSAPPLDLPLENLKAPANEAPPVSTE